MSLVLAGLAALVFSLAAFTAFESRRIAARHPPQGRFVRLDGGAIHVVERNPLGAPRGTVALIHGASGNAMDMIAALGERLAAQGFRVLSVDRPGHGWSARLGGREMASPVRQAAALRQALGALGVERAIVVGHSLGALSALATALDAPEFVAGLVLLAPVSHPWPGGVTWYYPFGARRWLGPPFRRLVALPGALLSMRAGIASVFAPAPAPPGFAPATSLPLLLRPLHFKANAEDAADAKRHAIAMSPRYREIAAPSMIVSGDRDGIVYTHIHSAGCLRDIAGATLTTLPGVGHSPHHADASAVVAAIVEVARRAGWAEN